MWAGRAAARCVASSAGRLDLGGVFPPIPTPFHHDESLAFDKLKANIAAWERIPFKGYVVQGSNGEYPLMTASERVEMVRRVRELIPASKLLIAGSSAESTRETIDLSTKMAAAGANAVMIVTPSYFKSNMTVAALQAHYEHVADESPVPVILYNMPANTGIDMVAGLVVRLAQHPNIIAIKDSGGDITKIARVIQDTKGCDFQVLAGSTGFLLPSLLVGAVGGINGLANILGAEVCRLHALAAEGRFKEAVDLHLRLVTPNALVTREFGVPGMKCAMDLVGMYGGPCRRPLQELSTEDKQKIKSAFQAGGFLP